MGINFNNKYKDILHQIMAKFIPAYLPDAKKPYNLKTVSQPELDIYTLASKAEVYNITTPPEIIKEGLTVGFLLIRYLVADGYIFKGPLFTLKVGFPGEYDGTETSLPDNVYPSARFQVSEEFRKYLRKNVNVTFGGKLETDGVIARVIDEATGAEDEVITIGRLLTIRGFGMKLDGNGENAGSIGVFFRSKDDPGERIKVLDIAVNEPRTLKVIVPTGLKEDVAYTIEVVTQSSVKGHSKLLKKTRTITSDFTVTARK